MLDSGINLRHEIQHAIFTGIVGYLKRLIEEQEERSNQLTTIVLAAKQVRESFLTLAPLG